MKCRTASPMHRPIPTTTPIATANVASATPASAAITTQNSGDAEHVPSSLRGILSARSVTSAADTLRAPTLITSRPQMSTSRNTAAMRVTSTMRTICAALAEQITVARRRSSSVEHGANQTGGRGVDSLRPARRRPPHHHARNIAAKTFSLIAAVFFPIFLSGCARRPAKASIRYLVPAAALTAPVELSDCHGDSPRTCKRMKATWRRGAEQILVGR